LPCMANPFVGIKVHRTFTFFLQTPVVSTAASLWQTFSPREDPTLATDRSDEFAAVRFAG